MKRGLSSRPLLTALAFVVFAAMDVRLSTRIDAAQFGDHSFLTNVSTGDEQGLVIIAPDARNRDGEFHAEVTVSVHDLEPNTTYQVWRAIDFVPDGVYDPAAPGTGWAEIGTITTSAAGAGTLHIIRGGGLFSGDQFDVVLQVRLDDGSTVVLESDAMTITVK
jgi:hypothetical protein